MIIRVLAALFLLTSLGAADDGPLNPAPPDGITPEQIIQRFAAQEKAFKAARESYIFRQSVKVQTLDGSTVNGEYQMVVDIGFDDQGRRKENVIYAPQPNLRGISMSPEDHADLENRVPFALNSDEVHQYNIGYAGQQRVDELETFVFDVSPKVLEKGKRYFEGRIWVDNQDFQIVKTFGKNVPDVRAKKKGQQENLFPKFTTWREQIDGKHWFPTYSRADDTLNFESGDIRMRMIVKYSNYQRFETAFKEKVTFEGTEVTSAPTSSRGTIAGRPARGHMDAKVEIVVFDDFQCPACAQLYDTIFNDVMRTHGDRVRVLYKDYPLSNHPWAMRAALNANCLAEQNHEAYWDFSGYVHLNQREITGDQRPLREQTAALDRQAEESAGERGLNASQLKACIKSAKNEGILASIREGNSLGVDSTPTLFVNGEKVAGAIPAQDLRRLLDRILREASRATPSTSKAPGTANNP
jgi:protein-disulfide isomerase